MQLVSGRNQAKSVNTNSDFFFLKKKKYVSSFIKATAKEVSYLLRDFSNAIMYFSKISSVPVLRSFSNYHRNFSVFPLPPSNLNQISSNLIVLALTVIFATIFKFSSIYLFFFQSNSLMVILFYLIRIFMSRDSLIGLSLYKLLVALRIWWSCWTANDDFFIRAS